MPVNARTIWDAGAILGYCTDTTYDPKAGLDHELKGLNVMFSMQDLIKMMGPNTASYIQMGDQLGTLEPGKLAACGLAVINPPWRFDEAMREALPWIAERLGPNVSAAISAPPASATVPA